MTDRNKLFSFKEMDIGTFFYDTWSKHYGIKLSSCRAYNIDSKCVYGFAGNHADDTDNKHYLVCDYEVY